MFIGTGSEVVEGDGELDNDSIGLRNANTLCSSAIGGGGAGLYISARSSMSVTRERTRGKVSSLLRYRLMYRLRSMIAAWRRSCGEVAVGGWRNSGNQATVSDKRSKPVCVAKQR